MKQRGKRVLIGCSILALLFIFSAAWGYRNHILFWWLFESLGPNAQGYKEYRHRKTGITMVRLPGGSALMGSPVGEDGRAEYEPEHQVVLSGFLMAKHEVTQAQWAKVMGANPAHWKGDALPVHMVSWEDVQEFCRRTLLKLPTEAQWEYACRGSSRLPFAFGKVLAKDQANFTQLDGPSLREPVEVDSFRPNAFGLYCMHGNVAEWCLDTFDITFYSKREAQLCDPVSASPSETQVIRGGGWANVASGCRAAFRFGFPPSQRRGDLGFRPAFYPLP